MVGVLVMVVVVVFFLVKDYEIEVSLSVFVCCGWEKGDFDFEFVRGKEGYGEVL